MPNWEIDQHDQAEVRIIHDKMRSLTRNLKNKTNRLEGNDPNKKSLNESLDALENLSEAFESIIDSITPDQE